MFLSVVITHLGLEESWKSSCLERVVYITASALIKLLLPLVLFLYYSRSENTHLKQCHSKIFKNIDYNKLTKKNWWQRVQNERNCCHCYRHRLLDDNSNDIFYITVAQSHIPTDKK